MRRKTSRSDETIATVPKLGVPLAVGDQHPTKNKTVSLAICAERENARSRGGAVQTHRTKPTKELVGRPSFVPQVEVIIRFESGDSHVKNKNNLLAIYLQMPEDERMRIACVHEQADPSKQ